MNHFERITVHDTMTAVVGRMTYEPQQPPPYSVHQQHAALHNPVLMDIQRALDSVTNRENHTVHEYGKPDGMTSQANADDLTHAKTQLGVLRLMTLTAQEMIAGMERRLKESTPGTDTPAMPPPAEAVADSPGSTEDDPDATMDDSPSDDANAAPGETGDALDAPETDAPSGKRARKGK